MRRAVVITLTDPKRRVLTAWSRIRTIPVRQAARAKIVLRAAEERTNQEIAEEVAIERTVVVPGSASASRQIDF